MTIQWGDTGKVVVGPLKTFTVTTPTPYENLLGTPQSLGTVAPTGGAAGDISYTLQASDFPTISPSPYSTKYCAYFIVSGQNLSGASVTLTYNILKNGTNLFANQSTASVINNNYWTHSHYRFYDVSVGDTLEVQTWASATGVNLSYYAVFILPTRMELTKASIVKDFSLTPSSQTLTKGTPSPALTGAWYIYPTNATTDNLTLNAASTRTSIAICINAALNGFSLGRIGNGDAALSSGIQSNSSNHPYYYKNYYPASVSFREILR